MNRYAIEETIKRLEDAIDRADEASGIKTDEFRWITAYSILSVHVEMTVDALKLALKQEKAA